MREIISDPFSKGGRLHVRTRCTCGHEADVAVRELKRGKQALCLSCTVRAGRVKNGTSWVTSPRERRVYNRVKEMRRRCTDPRDPGFKNYGGRGIEFRFASLKDGFDYVLSELPHVDYFRLDIDRRDNDGHYEPGNLRLATRSQNMLNRRRK